MDIIQIILLVVLVIVLLITLYYITHPKYRKHRRGIVSPRIAQESRIALQYFYSEFEKYYKRKPNQNELIRLIIMASHLVIKQRNLWGHWMRWRIRMFLASENGVWYGKRAAKGIKVISVK